MTNQATWGAQLRLPVQAAPVDRTPGAAAAVAVSGVTASAWTDLFSPPTGPVGFPIFDPTVLASLL
jgi:hypothetical protein